MKWKRLYDKRTSTKRYFSRLKEHLGLNNQMSKGIKKTKFHAFLCCKGLIAGLSMNIQEKNN
jgi:hypothetical protein